MFVKRDALFLVLVCVLRSGFAFRTYLFEAGGDLLRNVWDLSRKKDWGIFG